jgi:hypothetical protein
MAGWKPCPYFAGDRYHPLARKIFAVEVIFNTWIEKSGITKQSNRLSAADGLFDC